MICYPVRITLLLPALLCLSISVAAQQDRTATDSTNGDPPKAGLRVIEVLPGSSAAAAGLQPMDAISKYGDFAVVDAASYFVARDAHQRTPGAKVEIVYWHGRERMTSIISPGRMGIKFSEYSPANNQLQSLIQRLDLLNVAATFAEGELPSAFLPSRESLAKEIDAAIQKGASDGSLTPAQVLVAKITAILDDAPPPEIEKQSALVKELISNHTYGLIDYLSYEVFFHRRRYHAAVPCFKKVLEYRPDDANVRLNLGIAYWHVQKYSEAEATADYAMQHSSGGLTKHGYVVAYQVKANAALGIRDFAKALDYADQAAKLEGSSGYLMLLSSFAAAEAGDMARFNEIIKDFEKSLAPDYARLRPRLDAVEALVLSKTGQLDKARLLANKSMGTADPEANAKYWLQYPNGDDVLAAWKQLLPRN